MAFVQCKFKQTQISSLYKQVYAEKFLWPTLLSEPLRSYMSLMSVAKNLPVTVAMGSIIPLTACVCGPKTEIKVEQEYKMKLNTYSMVVAAPGHRVVERVLHINSYCKARWIRFGRELEK